MASVSVWGGSGGLAHSSRPGSLAFPASAVVTLRPSGEFHSPRIGQEAEPLPTRPSSGWLYSFLDQFRAIVPDQSAASEGALIRIPTYERVLACWNYVIRTSLCVI